MRIEVEIGLQMVIPELEKLPEFEENYWDYYEVYDLMVEVCDLFNDYQDGFVAKFSGENDKFYIMIDGHSDYYNELYRVAHGAVFSLLWDEFLPIVNFWCLLEKHSIIDNSKNLDYLYEPECELRREV